MRKTFRSILSIFVVTIAIFTSIFLLLILKYNGNPLVKEVKLISYDEKKDIIEIAVTKQDDFILHYDYECIIESNKDEYRTSPKDGKCTFHLPLNHNYDIKLKNNLGESKKTNLFDHVDNKLSFKFSKNKIYLAIDEKYEIQYKDKYIVPIDVIYEFYSEDEEIVKIENGKIVGVKAGTTKVGVKGLKEKMEVTVTDLITKPTLAKKKKTVIPCHQYNKEEAEMLDELLKFYIDEAGFETRAGAVAAGRFLTLQLKYRIPYFYENGRINNSGVHLADGEGRYYKQGMYFHEDKFKDIKYTYAGKAIWGCPLKNGTSNPKYGFISGGKNPNGLDCSGFVSWALVNGGFDPGDVGAGENPGIYQLTDTGKFTKLTHSLATSGKIKTGDLFNFWGHIALIIGQDKNNYYVAESLPYLGGVIAKTYAKNKVANTFEFVVFMDEFYKADGNLKDYWE